MNDFTRSSHERPPLDPATTEMRELGYQLVDRLVDHMSTLSNQPVVSNCVSEDLKHLTDNPLQENPTSLSDCLDTFFHQMLPQTPRSNHPRFHGFLPAPASFAGMLGQMLASGTNTFTGTALGGGSLNELELAVLRWISEMLHCPDLAHGLLTSGGSMANLTALAAARSRNSGRYDQAVFYVTCETHSSVRQAIALLGYPTTAVREIPMDADFRMDPAALTRQLQDDCSRGCVPIAVVATAGTTNLGRVDPLDEIAAVCREHSVWFHVDAAYGGFARLTTSGKQRLAGMELADSVTLDPHKWLYCPLGIGCLLVRDPEALRTAFAHGGAYLQDTNGANPNFCELGPELSRPARVLPVWMVLKSCGRRQLADQIDHDLRLARLAADQLSEDERLEVLPPELSIVGFRHRARPGETEADRAARDQQLLRGLNQGQDVLLSSTIVDGRSTLRLVVMNHRTTDRDIYYTCSRIRLHAV